MFVKERQEVIIKLLNENGKVEVNVLSKKFNVSKDLIRKDLQKLEEQGILERTYGGAILKRTIAKNLSVWSRVSANTDEKRKIAKKAFSLIKPGETIFLDITSVNFFLADEIAKADFNITVITNMIDVMHLLYHSNNVNLIGIGGTLNKDLDGFVGTVSIEQAKKYKTEKAFIGTVGIDPVSGTLTTFDSEDGLMKETIINSSKIKYLITEKQKVYQDGNFIYSNLKQFDGLISGDELPKETKKLLKKMNVNII